MSDYLIGRLDSLGDKVKTLQADFAKLAFVSIKNHEDKLYAELAKLKEADLQREKRVKKLEAAWQEFVEFLDKMEVRVDEKGQWTARKRKPGER